MEAVNTQIKVGTISELDGTGIEYLVDVATRSVVLAKFFNGKMVVVEASTVSSDEDTVITK